MGRPNKHDWESLFALYAQERFNDPKIKQTQWCIDHGVNPTAFSKHMAKYRKKPLDPKQFAVIKETARTLAKEEIAEMRKDAREILKAAAPDVAQHLVEMATQAESESVKLGASNSVLDRAGFGDEKANVNVNVQIPVLIAGVSSDQIKQMLGA